MNEEIGVEKKKYTQWKHLAVRPETFKEFRMMKDNIFRSDDAFLADLIKDRKIRLMINTGEQA